MRTNITQIWFRIGSIDITRSECTNSFVTMFRMHQNILISGYVNVYIIDNKLSYLCPSIRWNSRSVTLPPHLWYPTAWCRLCSEYDHLVSFYTGQWLDITGWSSAQATSPTPSNQLRCYWYYQYYQASAHDDATIVQAIQHHDHHQYRCSCCCRCASAQTQKGSQLTTSESLIQSLHSLLIWTLVHPLPNVEIFGKGHHMRKMWCKHGLFNICVGYHNFIISFNNYKVVVTMTL